MQRCKTTVSYTMALLVFLCSATVVSAQERTVETSSRKAPGWIGITVNDHFIASASAGTLETAKELAMADIRSQIVNAVASNIVSVEETYITSERADDREAYRSGYASHVRTTAAFLPFITGIAFSDDTEAYWEKIRNRKTKEFRYSYHLKYHFPKTRIEELIAEYMKLDTEQWNKFLELKSGYDTLSDVEDIAKAINELSALSSWFEEGWRKEEVLSLQKSYRDVFPGIYIKVISNRPGYLEYCLMFKDRILECTRKPVLKSEYATEMTWCPKNDGTCNVRYSYAGVLAWDKKEIQIIYNFGNKTLRHVVNFNIQ